MLDFLIIAYRLKGSSVEIYPKFKIIKSEDLMIRGGDFYAIWVEDKGLWSTDEQDALRLIDRELAIYARKNEQKLKALADKIHIFYMWDSDSGMIDKWHKYCQRQSRDCYVTLDSKIIFSNTEVSKLNYASKKLEYALEEGDIKAWDKIIGTLYSEAERHKIEWTIGAIVSGESKRLQKFLVFYGASGTGKSTIMNIMTYLFDGYYTVFDSNKLGSRNSSFALEPFRNNPLLAIQHDGDLSRIEDNTRLNSLVSHEEMTMDIKFQSTFTSRFNCFLVMGTNKPVKITDAKSGIIRRLIDVEPTGRLISVKEYDKLMNEVKFELGAIASHCQGIYLKDPHYYDSYVPMKMIGATNDFFNFIEDSYPVFKKQGGTTMKAAWEMYKTYCEEAKVQYPYSQRLFKEELKNYFEECRDRHVLEDGTRVRNYYLGFKFPNENVRITEITCSSAEWLDLKPQESYFDRIAADYTAQLAKEDGTPKKSWANVTTRLRDIPTSELHYVQTPLNHIFIDFDLKDEFGNKSLTKNLEAASKWPETYAEVSQGGQGLHLHYYYTGDASKLSHIYDDDIEIKYCVGNSSVRRKLSLCNSHAISSISSGLPLKEVKMVDTKTIEDERHLRRLIKKALYREIHTNTKPSIDFIKHVLDEAYNSGMVYDVTDMRQTVLFFAHESSHQSAKCLELFSQMKFKSEDKEIPTIEVGNEIVFYDVEVFPNLFLVNWKLEGSEKPVNRMINPEPKDIERLLEFRLIGFNNRRYDNHIIYARLLGYTNEQLYELSQHIINPKPGTNPYFREAYNLSYTDVYDFCSKKQTLKLWEIELGIHHKELGLPWDEPVDPSMWEEVAAYCDNDVIATEAVWNARQGDFKAREMLVALIKDMHHIPCSVNDTTNTLSSKIIFGSERHPQSEFNWRDMGDSSKISQVILDDYTCFDEEGKPIFRDYEFGYKSSFTRKDAIDFLEGQIEAEIIDGPVTEEMIDEYLEMISEASKKFESWYRGEVVGEGGHVYAEPGIYYNVGTDDVASMHPTSAIMEKLFGKYTERFEAIRDTRLLIKHGKFDEARHIFNGVFAPYLEDESLRKDLAQALKIVINSVYGLTAAKFENPFRDPRNVDNIVAKRGALFMINLKHYVQDLGYTVAHIKTDSIKVPEMDDYIHQKIVEYGKLYGYDFERESNYERMCLVNNAVYVARYPDGTWTATGTQFQVPYVFKTLFSKEPIEFEDCCVTKSVSGGAAIVLDMGNDPTDIREDRLIFIGRVGSFTPVIEGGGTLYRKSIKNGEVSYDAISGTKGFTFLESEVVNDIANVDRTYFDVMVNKAIDTISKFGDFEEFVR